MKLLDTIAAKLGYTRPPSRLESDYSAAMVYPSGVSHWWTADLDIEDAARRMTQFVEVCSRRKSQVCADQAIRLMVKKRAVRSERARRSMGIRPIGKRAAAYLRNPTGGPGRKAAMWAEQSDYEEVTSHPAIDLLHSPNRWTTCTEFFRSLYYTLDYAGNFFAEHDGEGSRPPETLIVMTPQYTRVIPDPVEFIAGYRYGRYGHTEQDLGTDQVLHLRQLPHPSKPWIGLPTIKAMLIEADLDSASSVSELSMWQNGARPDYKVMLPAEMTTKEQIAQVTASLNSQLRGPQNRGKFYVTNAVGIEPLQFTAREMEYLGGKRDSVQRILACEGIPESEIFMNDANYATARAGSVQFLRMTIRSNINMVAEFLTQNYLPLFNIVPGEMFFAYDDPVPSDEQATITNVSTLYGAGIITKNEARDEIGRDPVDEGDDFKAEPPSLMGGGFGAANEEPEDEDGEPEAKSLRGCKARIKALPDPNVETVRRLERTVAKWIEGIATALESADIGVNLSKYAPEFARVVKPYIARLFADGFEFVAGDSLPITPYKAAEAFAEQHVVKLANAETATIQADLQEAISTSIANGQSTKETMENVSFALKDQSGYRAERISRTETSRSMQEGMKTEWKAQGVKRMKWELSPDPCELCIALAERANAGGGVPIDGTVLNIGDSVEYGDGKQYTNTYLPLTTAQGHPNCRCTMVPA